MEGWGTRCSETTALQVPADVRLKRRQPPPDAAESLHDQPHRREQSWDRHKRGYAEFAPRPETRLMSEPVELKRTLTLPLVTFYGLGTILGAGIYVLVGEVAGIAGMQTPLAFAIAALVAVFTAFSYAELAARHPRSAAEAVYGEQQRCVRWSAEVQVVHGAIEIDVPGHRSELVRLRCVLRRSDGRDDFFERHFRMLFGRLDSTRGLWTVQLVHSPRDPATTNCQRAAP